MAAPIVGVSFFALLVILPVAFIVVLGVFKLIAWAGNTMLGRTNPVHSDRVGLGLWPLIVGAIPICLIVASLFLVRVRTVQSVQVNSSGPAIPQPSIHVDGPQFTVIQDGTAVSTDDLADKHREIMQAMQQQEGQIPVELPKEIPAATSKPAPEPMLDKAETGSSVSSAGEAENSVAVTGDAPAESSTEDPATNMPTADVVKDGSVPDQTAPPINSAEVANGSTPAVSDAVITPPTTPAAETPEQRQARLTELASHISPWIRSLLKETQPEDSPTSTDVAEAVESSDKQIVVFQLAGPIRQKYALIPLTPAFDAAMSPVTPFLANGSLESIAESLATFLKQPAETATEVSSATSANEGSTRAQQATPTKTSTSTTVAFAESTGDSPSRTELSPAEQLPEAMVGEITPDWVDNPQPHQFVVRTDALFPEESPVGPLNRAINEVLPERLKLDEDSLAPALRAQAQLVRLELDEKTSQACVIKTFERLQAVGNEGSEKQNMRFVYALVELPEFVRKAAAQTVRMSLQRDRVTGLAVIVGFAWLAICAAGIVVRLWGRGGFFRKMIAIPILCLVCIPLLLLAVGTGAATAGIRGSKMPRYPFADSSKPIRVQM